MNELRKAREALGLRQEAVAGAAEISLTYYRTLEDGKSVPTLGIARRVAAALDSSIDELWPEADPEPAA